MIIYVWAAVGFLIFEDRLPITPPDQEYTQQTYFGNMRDSIFIMVQVLFYANWSGVLYPCGEVGTMRFFFCVLSQ